MHMEKNISKIPSVNLERNSASNSFEAYKFLFYIFYTNNWFNSLKIKWFIFYDFWKTNMLSCLVQCIYISNKLHNLLKCLQWKANPMKFSLVLIQLTFRRLIRMIKYENEKKYLITSHFISILYITGNQYEKLSHRW